MRSRAVLPGILLAAGASVMPGLASAQDCPPAEWAQVVERSRKAKVLLDELRFDDALATLREAFGICPEPKLHRAMGRVHEAAGRPLEALAEYRACADEVADDAAREECRRQSQVVEGLLARTGILLDDVPPDASVRVDGVEVSRDGDAPIRVAPGRHLVEVRSDGRPPFQATLDVEPGATPQVQIVMAAIPAPDPSPPPAVVSPPASVSAFAPETAWNWVGLGAGAVATGLGVAFLIQYGLDKRAAEDAHYDPVRQGWWAADEVGPRNLALGVSFAAAGIAAVVTSAVLWPQARVNASVAPAPGGGFVAVSLSL